MNPILPAIVSFDQNSIRSIARLQNELLNPIMIAFTRIGDSGAVWISMVIVLLLLEKYRYEGKVICSWLILNTLIGEWMLKHIFERERPFLELPEIVLKIPAPITTSFPSWHTSISWCFTILFTYYFWTRTKTLVIAVWWIAIGITVSRLYLQVHYPSDVIAGILVGIMSSLIVLSIWKIRNRWGSKKLPS